MKKPIIFFMFACMISGTIWTSASLTELSPEERTKAAVLGHILLGRIEDVKESMKRACINCEYLQSLTTEKEAIAARNRHQERCRHTEEEIDDLTKGMQESALIYQQAVPAQQRIKSAFSQQQEISKTQWDLVMVKISITSAKTSVEASDK